MPTYVYKCQACGLIFEEQQKITDPPVTECQAPFCDGQPRRVPQLPGIAFKGPGFYKTDYCGSTFAKERETVASGGEAHLKFDG